MANETPGKTVLEEMLKVRTSYPADVLKSRQILAREAPEYLALFHQTYLHLFEQRKALSPVMKELIIIAVDAAQHYERGLRSHMKSALKLGATKDEIVEALLACALASGIHPLSIAMPILEEVLQEWEQEKQG